MQQFYSENIHGTESREASRKLSILNEGRYPQNNVVALSVASKRLNDQTLIHHHKILITISIFYRDFSSTHQLTQLYSCLARNEFEGNIDISLSRFSNSVKTESRQINGKHVERVGVCGTSHIQFTVLLN